MPIDRLKSFGYKITVGLAEMPVAEPIPFVGTHWRRVSRLQDQMFGAVYLGSFLSSIIAPEQEYYIRSLFGDGADYSVGKLLPASVLV